MGDAKGFLKVRRQESDYRPVCERVKDYDEVNVHKTDNQSVNQAFRCMDCGTPFCHWGCPVGNYIPEWNGLLLERKWEKAFDLLNATNNFPEITGRICPAPCEYSCVLGINDDPVTIRENELSIVERAFKKGIVTPKPPKVRSDKKIAVIGSGPAGLACAVQLNIAGHNVDVYERENKVGGLLRYGIPDFKLDKSVIDRRVEIMKKEGINFITSTNAGVDISCEDLAHKYDSICLAGGSRVPRDLKCPGRDLKGIYFAMDYLIQSNKKVSGEYINGEEIDVKDKKVIVIGGGDTGSDCVGTAHRQGAACVVQIEVMPQPEECRTDKHPWPQYPLILKTSSSHQEGGERHWSVLTKQFAGVKGQIKRIDCVKVEFVQEFEGTCPAMKEIKGSDFSIEADVVIIAVGFVHPEHNGLLEGFGVELDQRGNVKTGEGFNSSVSNVFSAGDMRRGQSLVVWAISEGRKAAHSIDKHLMGESSLPKM